MCRRAYKFRLFPNKPQERAMDGALETCRRAYNRLLDWRKDAYEQTGKSPDYYEQKRALPGWKKEDPLLQQVHAHVLQDVCKRVDLAFDAFFRRTKAKEEPGYPRFKGCGWYDSMTWPEYGNGVKIRGRKLWCSKLGSIDMKQHRPIPGTIKTCTLRRQNGKWYACFSVEMEPERLPPSEEAVGIDVGLSHFATLSTGERIENPRFFRTQEKALAKAGRKLAERARRTMDDKSSKKGRAAAKKVVGRVHERIRNRRHDFVHQVAHLLVERFGKLYVEKLDIKEMQSKGRRGMNKSIADAAWGMFRSVLHGKAESAGREYGEKEPAYTTQDCCECGHRTKLALSQRVYSCENCGSVKDRDHNSALNLLAMGLHGIGRRPVEAPGFSRGE